MTTDGKSTFSRFFKEDAQTIQEILYGKNSQQDLNIVGAANKEIFPKINISQEVSEDQFKSFWKSLRLFFRSGGNTKGLGADFSPVIMAPLYTKTMVGTDFPVWVADENHDGSGEFCLSLKDILTRCLNEITQQEGDTHILKENIERILHISNQHLADRKAQLFQTAIQSILDELEKQLEVKGDEVKTFNKSLDNLKNTLPKNGVLLPYTNNTSLQLFEAALVSTQVRLRKNLTHDIKQLKCRLKDLLRVEREKGPNREIGDKMRDSLSFVDSMMNFNELSSMLPGAGSESMAKERKERITAIVTDLEEAESILNQNNFVIVDETLYNSKIINWENIFENASVEVYRKGKGCDSVRNSFDKHMDAWTKLFISKKIAELEFENNYQADVHDEFFNHFNWQNLTVNELNCCPQIIMISDDVQLFDTEFNKISSLLSDNIPVKILALKRDSYVNYGQNGSGKKSIDLHTHVELAALMLSCKNIYVSQSTSITPGNLFNEFKEGLSATAPSFFYVLNVDEDIHENAYLWTSATIESRDFPGFTFKGLLGTPWGSRFKVDNNPQSNKCWPVYNFTVIDEKGINKEMEFPFTYADQAALNPDYHQYYLPVNSSFWSENLIPITEYMENSDEDNIGKVPFIWMMDKENDLHKVAVSWPIVLATQERMDFWRFLQENSGINNYHVAEAVKKARTEMEGQQQEEIEELKRKFQDEIAKVREEEAGKVMENLTSVLLNLDTSNIIPTHLPSTESLQDTSPSVEPDDDTYGESQDVAEEDESVLINDPYIDTALCTSCNECTAINKEMFKYNADKMAYIADPKAGTFSELVKAAELCPVNIIHPGTPLNPNEPDLDDLIERAKKFNE